MALSYVNYTGDGSNRIYSIPFPYLDRSHIYVQVNGVDVTYAWLNDQTIQTISAPPNGAKVSVLRITPRDERLVDFVDASVLTEADLDLNALQTFYIVQEAVDIAGGSESAAAAAQSEANAAMSANEALTHRDNAYRWSSQAEAVPVDDGTRSGFSAFHWAVKAASWAASVLLPLIAGNGGKYLRAKADATGYELVSPTDVRADIGAAAAAHNHGNVTGPFGVGNTAPADLLHVGSSTNLSAVYARIENAIGRLILGRRASGSAMIETTGATGLDVIVNGATRLAINSSGYITMGAQPYFLGSFGSTAVDFGASFSAQEIRGITHSDRILTVPSTGVYLVSWTAEPSTTGTWMGMRLFRNGAYSGLSSSGTTTQSTAFVIGLAAGDQLQLAPSAQPTANTPQVNRFSLAKIA